MRSSPGINKFRKALQQVCTQSFSPKEHSQTLTKQLRQVRLIGGKCNVKETGTILLYVYFEWATLLILNKFIQLNKIIEGKALSSYLAMGQMTPEIVKQARSKRIQKEAEAAAAAASAAAEQRPATVAIKAQLTKAGSVTR